MSSPSSRCPADSVGTPARSNAPVVPAVASLCPTFTGAAAVPADASVRNNKYVERQVELGNIYWHPLEDRSPRPE